MMFMLSFAILPVAAQDSEWKEVHDKFLESQIKFQYGPGVSSDELQPEWWYNLMHHNYKNEYRNNFTTTTLINEWTSKTGEEVEESLGNADTLQSQKLAEFAYRTLDLSYLIVRNEVEEIKHTFNTYNDSIRRSTYAQADELSTALNEMFEEKLDKINVIKASHIDNDQRREDYDSYMAEMDTIVFQTKQIWMCIKTVKKRKLNL